ncbi:MAG: dihydroorotase [Paracoccaceae bacterium]
MQQEINSIEIITPDDWHLHLRESPIIDKVFPYSFTNYGRAIIMPNLEVPIIKFSQAKDYYKKIKSLLKPGIKFEPLMTLFLSEETKVLDIYDGVKSGIIKAIKFYPQGVTTNSDGGIKNLSKIYKLLEKLPDLKIPLLIHGETSNSKVDIYDREAYFLEETIVYLRERIPELKIVLEHITTKDSVDYILENNSNIAATITAHHLIINRNHLFDGGLRPHYYCRPIAKRELHRVAIRKAATSGNLKFFLGTDSAPHFDNNKENSCGCAGIFSAPNALGYVAQVFEEDFSLNNLENFISINGANFYNLPLNSTFTKFTKFNEPIKYPDKINVGKKLITVFNPGYPLYWKNEILNQKDFTKEDS